MTGRLTSVVPWPAPLATVGPAPDRPALLRELAHRPWAELDWPDLLDELRALGRTDVPLGRLVEGHADALRILAQAGRTPVGDAVYGVWASRSHATGVRAEPVDQSWHLTGTLRFASGVGLIDRALVPVWLDEQRHQLLDLDVGDWAGDPDSWRTRAMVDSLSLTVAVDATAPRSAAVADTGFYLDRPGFFPGGVGVAAVWAGGAARVVDLALASCAGPHDGPVRLARWGRIRVELACAAALLDAAGRELAQRELLERELTDSSADPSTDPTGQALSTEVRAGVARSVRAVLDEVRALAGPAGLAYDEQLTRAVDDLGLYVAQQNRDSDEPWLGGGLAGERDSGTRTTRPATKPGGRP